MKARFHSLVSRRNLLAAVASAPLTAGLNVAAHGRDATCSRHVVIVGDCQLDCTLGWAEIITELTGDEIRRGTLLATEPGDPDPVRGLLRRIPDDASNLVLAAGREELRLLECGRSA